MSVIKIKSLFDLGNKGDLYDDIDSVLDKEGMAFLDFAGVEKSDIEDVMDVMSICMRLRYKGGIIKIINIPFVLRDQFLLSGLNNLFDEITI